MSTTTRIVHAIVPAEMDQDVETERRHLSGVLGTEVTRSEAIRSLLRRGLAQAARARCSDGPPALVLGRAPR